MKIKNIKYIYVLDSNGKPLMPTKRLGMVRRWLTSGQAHYQLRPHDLVRYQNQIWQVKGVQNRGRYIKLTKRLVKDVVTNIKNVAILLHVNGCLISLD